MSVVFFTYDFLNSCVAFQPLLWVAFEYHDWYVFCSETIKICVFLE